MQEKTKKLFKEALTKKALGYNYDEVIEEYSSDNESLKLVKRRITKKHYPPDLSAMKELAEFTDAHFNEVKNMTDAQLYSERDKILATLKREKYASNES